MAIKFLNTVQVDTDVLYVDTANDRVGIGTTSPSTKLHVSGGDIRIDDTERIEFGAGGVRINNDAAGRMYYRAPLGFYWETNGGYRMTIDSSGNVGIGTTSPGEKLQVDGVIDANGSDGYKINGKAWAVEVSNNLQLGDWDGQEFSTSIYDNNSANIVTIKDYGTTINCSSLISSYGDSASLAVGTIGSSSAGAAVITLANRDTTASAGDPTGAINFAIKADTGANTLGYTSAIISGSIFANAGTGNAGGGILDFKTSPTGIGSSPENRIRINQLGDVGIGTTSPSTKLHVNGNLRLGTTGTFIISQSPFTTTTFNCNAGNGSTVLFGAPTSYQQNVLVQGDLSTQSGSTSSYLGTKLFGSFNNRLDPSGDNYLNSGDLGIGTTSPSYKLDVSGEGRFTGDLRCLSLIQTSQRDQKENINDIDKSKAKAIPFKEYTYKSSIDGSSRKRYGVVVEDIEDDYPELVHTDADGVKGVNYIDLLVKRVAELEKELEDISLTPGANGADGTNGTNGLPGAKGATGSAGSNGKDGNSHLSNITSIGINGKSGQLEIVIGTSTYKFNPDK